MNRLYIAGGADFRFASAEEIQATAHRLIDHHYRCAVFLHGAADVVLYHNHPSGDSIPTAVDPEV